MKIIVTLLFLSSTLTHPVASLGSESDQTRYKQGTQLQLPTEIKNLYRLSSDLTFEPIELPTELKLLPHANEIEQASRQANVDPRLVHALIAVESNYRQKALSPKGAIGLMQVLPETSKRMGVSNPGKSSTENLKAGTRYLKNLQNTFAGRLDLAIAAYNAGENAVIKHHYKIPPYAETRQYVPSVITRYETLVAHTPTPKSESQKIYQLNKEKLADFKLKQTTNLATSNTLGNHYPPQDALRRTEP